MGLTNKKTNGSDNKNQIQQPQQNSNSAASSTGDALDRALDATGIGEPGKFFEQNDRMFDETWKNLHSRPYYQHYQHYQQPAGSVPPTDPSSRVAPLVNYFMSEYGNRRDLINSNPMYVFAAKQPGCSTDEVKQRSSWFNRDRVKIPATELPGMLDYNWTKFANDFRMCDEDALDFLERQTKARIDQYLQIKRNSYGNPALQQYSLEGEDLLICRRLDAVFNNGSMHNTLFYMMQQILSARDFDGPYDNENPAMKSVQKAEVAQLFLSKLYGLLREHFNRAEETHRRLMREWRYAMQ